MVDASDYLSTPDNYATPEQLKSAREYATALLHGNMQQPIHHWTQGVSNMISALVGGSLDWNAAQREKAAMRQGAAAQQAIIPGQNYPTAPVGTSGQPFPTAGAPTVPFSKASAGGNEGAAIAGIESGGDYSNLGPVTKTGDRAYGKYQVMGNNVGPWTEEALGKAMTPDEFLRNPDAQEAVFKHKFGQYEQKYGPEGASRAWFAGESGMNDLGRKDQLGTTVGDYGHRFAMAFNGAPTQAPAAAAIEQVASKVAPKLPSPGVDVAPGGQAVVNPALVKPQPGYTPQQLQAVLANPWIDQNVKQQIMQLMLQRGQPITMDDPRGTGGKIMIDPNNPGTQQFFAPPPHWTESKIGDITTNKPVYIGPNGLPYMVSPQRVTPGAGPQSNAAPTSAPAAPQAPAATPVVAQQNNAPVAPAAASSAPVQVASNEPMQTATDAGPATEGPVGTPSPLAKFAQAAPPGVDPEDWAANIANMGAKRESALSEEAGKKAIEFGMKKYDTISSQAQEGRKLMPNIDLGLALINDPNFHSGLLAGAQDVWGRLKTAVLGDKYAQAPNEVFDKVIASNVLGTMRTALGGLGQVRLAEIDLLNRASGSRNNTPAANRAVLEISKLGLNKLDQLDGMAQSYMSGDEVIDPLTGNTMLKPNLNAQGEIEPRRGLDAGFDKIARQFTNAHPSLTQEQIKNYQQLFDAGSNEPAQATGEKKAEGAATLPLQAAAALKQNVVTTFGNGQKWTLGSDGKPKQVQ